MNVRDIVPWSRNTGSAGRDRSLSTPSQDTNPLFNLHREMDRLFDAAFRDFGLFGGRSQATWPHLELVESGDGYTLTAELPGLDEEDIDLSLQDGVLTLSGEKRSEHDDKQRGYSERSYGSFTRSITVGDIDPSKVEADFDKGVLTVTLPRSAEAAQRVKRIPINASATTH